MITVTPGDARDEITARDLLWRLRLTHPQITQIWADSAYSRDLLPAWSQNHLWLTLRPVLRPKGSKGVPPSRAGTGEACSAGRPHG
ncbi:hypothetical protein QFZ82_006640 [Streptomyces sp. V4I23]|nr:hypothetical protein [Streptomyces sp. V4I23]